MKERKLFLFYFEGEIKVEVKKSSVQSPHAHGSIKSEKWVEW